MNLTMLSPPTADLSTTLPGVWRLLSREDYNKEGQQRFDPVLGRNPLGILAYGKDAFSAQFMKQDRIDMDPVPAPHRGQNNTSAIDGYDAYFGIYKVDEQTGKVAHTLVGSISPANIGMKVSRDMRVHGDRLTIQLETTSPDGEPVLRTLIWERIS